MSRLGDSVRLLKIEFLTNHACVLLKFGIYAFTEMKLSETRGFKDKSNRTAKANLVHKRTVLFAFHSILLYFCYEPSKFKRVKWSSRIYKFSFWTKDSYNCNIKLPPSITWVSVTTRTQFNSSCGICWKIVSRDSFHYISKKIYNNLTKKSFVFLSIKKLFSLSTIESFDTMTIALILCLNFRFYFEFNKSTIMKLPTISPSFVLANVLIS